MTYSGKTALVSLEGNNKNITIGLSIIFIYLFVRNIWLPGLEKAIV